MSAKLLSWFPKALSALVMLFLIGLFDSQTAGAAGVCYVDASASGANSGASWADAYTGLQSALGASPCTEVWVATGTYKPTADTDRTISFTLKNGVALYGGFAGTETIRSQRDPVANVTILSGDIGTLGDPADNSYHVVSGGGTDNSAVLDGFTITAGNANAATSPNNSGGGIYNSDSSPTLSNMIFSANSANGGGAGMYNERSSPNLMNMTFSGNSATPSGRGGGMFNYYNSSPSLSNVTFSTNSADHGGGMSNELYGNPILSNVIFIDNSADVGGGMYNSNYSNPSLTDVTFNSNSAHNYRGGGMYNSFSSPSLTNVTFNTNSANYYGGGIFNGFSSSPTLTNVTFSGNSADQGGGMYNEGTNPTLTNVTFRGNAADYGGGIYNNGSGSLQIKDSIFWGDSASVAGAEIYNYTSGPSLADSVVADGCPSGATCTNILTTDPQLGPLVNNGGFTQTMALGAGSSAIDTGNDATCANTDQRGVTRPQGAHCDIGAYEFGFIFPTSTPSATPTPTLTSTPTQTLTPTVTATGMLPTHTPTLTPTRTSRPIYVNASATGLNDGRSWESAYIDLQSALTAAVSGREIWVAAGMYKPTNYTSRTISFTLKNGVALYGGFAGTETIRSQRDAAANVTILSGDIGMPNNTTDNSYHVVSSSTNVTAVLDGFTVTAGNANGASPNDLGGGMYTSTGNLTLANLIFSSNSAQTSGGGMYTNGSNLTLTDVILSWNSSQSTGGGMGNSNSNPTLNNVTFSGNSAPSGGGGMFNNNSNPTLTNVTFSNNSSTYYSSGSGGGMYNITSSNPALTNVTFSNNSASGHGGGMYNSTNSNPTLNNVTFSNNSAGAHGGGMYNTSSSPVLTNVTFTSNSATNNGGGMYNSDSSPILTNATFSGNSAGQRGGAMYNTDSPQIKNSIFWGDSASSNGAELYQASVNSIPSLADSVVAGGCPSHATCANLIASNPLLGILTNNGGFTQTMDLGPGSPAIDAGNDATCASTDQRGVTRPQGARCDIGAYEFDPTLPTPTITPTRTITPTPTITLTRTITPTRTIILTPTITPTLVTGVCYVKAGASGANNGSSWADAYADLQPALTASPCSEFWVAAGAYKPDSTDPSVSFVLKNGMALYGGFAGTETARSQRDPAANVTILSGDIGVAGDPDDNSYHVVIGSGTDSSAVLDGFTVTAGNANVVGYTKDSGGGMYNENGSPTLTNLIFRGNSAFLGGGIYNGFHGSLTLTHVIFSDNSAISTGPGSFTGYGGGMYSDASTSPILTDVTFSDNSASYGGGMANGDSSNAVLTNVTFNGNSANNDGGGMNNWGSAPVLANVIFSNNSAGACGGGMYNTYNQFYGNPMLTNVTFSGNSANWGGGGLCNEFNGNLTLTNVTFSGNSAYSGGGMLNDANSNAVLMNVTFGGNSANEGGGMYNWSDDYYSTSLTNVTFSGNSATNGGGMYNAGGNPALTNVTFSGNSATNGGGIYNNSSMGSPQIKDSIFWGDSASVNGAEFYGNSYNLDVADSVIAGGCPTDATCANILATDPLLGSLANNGGFTQTMALGVGSSAIDTGNDATCASTDQRGYPRPVDGDANGSAICDMGAYEAGSVPSLTQTPTPTVSPTLTPTHTPTMTMTPVITPTPTATTIPTTAPGYQIYLPLVNR